MLGNMADEQGTQQTAETEAPAFKAAETNVQQVSPEQFYREKSTNAAEQKPSKIQQVKDFLSECQRVLRITKKPDKEELKTIVKVSGLGMLVIGLLGFIIHLAKELLVK